MKFVDRQMELDLLQKKWTSKDPQLFVIYGKRRVGKTELIRQFIQDKPAIYYLADRRPEHDQLKDVAQRTGRFFKDDFVAKKGFSDWLECFAYLRSKVQQPLVLAIDEFPYLAENNKAVSSIFQKGWDEYLRRLPIFLILCGSSIAMMESEVLVRTAPLYGRRTGQILIQPMSFFEAQEFFPRLDFEDFLQVYTILGGMPAYLRQFNPDDDLETNVREKILTRGEFLFQEVEFALIEELREPRNYLSILKALSLGKRKFGEIINDTGLQKNVLTKYLHVLEDLRLIEKETPVTEDPLRSKKGLYRLQDAFFNFWFEYVFPHKSDLELGSTDVAVKSWRKTFEVLVAQAYERVAGEIVKKHQDHFFPVQRIGRWWERGAELDVVALNEELNHILFAEVKWSRKPVGTNIYQELRETSKKVRWGKVGRRETFCLFSKSGFTDGMKKTAKEENVYLFRFDNLLGI